MSNNVGRVKFIAANWKMNILTAKEGSDIDFIEQQYLNIVDKAFTEKNKQKECEVVIFPPHTHIGLLNAFNESNMFVGSQDISIHEKGAYTGEVSSECLVDIGATHVLVGHSERRQNHKESHSDVCKKAIQAINAKMGAVICIGETAEQKKAGKTIEVLTKQIDLSLPSIATAENIVLAYEPIWAIGTGEVLTPVLIDEIHKKLRYYIGEKKGKPFAENLRIIYGGSVKPSNAKEILCLDNVDGTLVGGASLQASDFAKIITEA